MFNIIYGTIIIKFHPRDVHFGGLVRKNHTWILDLVPSTGFIGVLVTRLESESKFDYCSLFRLTKMQFCRGLRLQYWNTCMYAYMHIICIRTILYKFKFRSL